MPDKGNDKLLWMIENVSVSASRRQDYLSDWYEFFNAETDVGDLLITEDEETMIDDVYHEVIESLQKAEQNAGDLYEIIKGIIDKQTERP